MNYTELKRLAESATPGPWEFKQKWADHVSSGTGDICILTDHLDTGFVRPLVERRSNAAYIAAASPSVVLSMIAEIDRLRTQNQALREALKTAIDHIAMDDLEISHCKDHAAIYAALAEGGV